LTTTTRASSVSGPPPGDDLPVAQAPVQEIPSTSAAIDERLAFTGAAVRGIILLGLVLLGLGTTMTRFRRLVEVRVAGRTATRTD
jgi:hypothetical protein